MPPPTPTRSTARRTVTSVSGSCRSSSRRPRVLDEQALADAIGVGLTPVRQALRRLAWESLVVILPRRGTIVADLHPADIENIFEMRLELEALAAELAALRATPAELDALDELMSADARRARRRERPRHADRARPRHARRAVGGVGQRAARPHARLAVRPRAAALELRAAAHRGHPGADVGPPRDRRRRCGRAIRAPPGAACTTTSTASSSRSAPPGAACASSTRVRTPSAGDD